jgi:hypothetical protein
MTKRDQNAAVIDLRTTAQESWPAVGRSHVNESKRQKPLALDGVEVAVDDANVNVVGPSTLNSCMPSDDGETDCNYPL